MKKALIFVFFLNVTILNAQSPGWDWIKTAGAESHKHSFGSVMVTDSVGNLFVSGSFQNDSIILGDIILYNPSAFWSLFIAKYNRTGDVLWAKRISSYINGSVKGTGLDIDFAGNVYLAGNYVGDTLVVESDTIFNTGFQEDIFLAKYDTSGNLIWAKALSGDHQDEVNRLEIDENGNIVLTGYFSSNSFNLGETTLTHPFIQSTPLPFIAKINSSGQTLWAKNGITDTWVGGGNAMDITTDQECNIYFTGSFLSNSITFDTITLTNTEFLNYNVFVVKYDPSGNVVWGQSAGFSGEDQGSGISNDKNDHFYLMGTFSSSFIVFGSDTLFNEGGMKNFLFKFTNSGNVVWKTCFGENEMDIGTSIKTDDSGSAFITGFLSEKKIFIVKYNSQGDTIWMKKAGGDTWNNKSYGIDINAAGNVFVTGSVAGPPVIFDNDTVASNFSGCYFVGKISFLTAIPSFAEICQGDSVFITANGATQYSWSPIEGLSDPEDSVLYAYPQTSVTYQLTGNKMGFTSFAKVQISVNPTPPIPAIIQQDSVLFSDSDYGNQWYLNDELIPGAIFPEFQITENGIYKVCVTNYYNCSLCSDYYIVNDLGTHNPTENIHVLPNPNDGIFSIETKTKILRIDIFNIQGEKIYSSEPANQKIIITLTNAINGIYHLRMISDENAVMNGKLLIYK